MRKKGPFCPKNGCGMINGAAMPYPTNCFKCNAPSDTHKKICLVCHHCGSCRRPGKKFFYESGK